LIERRGIQLGIKMFRRSARGKGESFRGGFHPLLKGRGPQRSRKEMKGGERRANKGLHLLEKTIRTPGVGERSRNLRRKNFKRKIPRRRAGQPADMETNGKTRMIEDTEKDHVIEVPITRSYPKEDGPIP